MKVFNHAMQRKQHFEHPRLASTKQWTKKNPSLVLSPSHILSSNWSRKTRANTYRELLSCATENMSPSPGRSCDGKQMAKNSRRFCIKRIEYMVFLFRNNSVKKCTLAPSQCAPRCLHKKKKKHLTETIWRAGMNILQIISVGRIPFLATIFCAICQ